MLQVILVLVKPRKETTNAGTKLDIIPSSEKCEQLKDILRCHELIFSNYVNHLFAKG
jgi:hypothetical protein